jgi:hypothetical protein
MSPRALERGAAFCALNRGHAMRTVEPSLKTEAVPLRRLGFAEVRMHLMHQLLHATTQGAAVLRLRGPLRAEAFRSALAGLMQKHEILQAEIERIEDALWFCKRGSFMPLPFLALRREDDEHWRRVLEQENSRPLCQDTGWWRIILLVSPEGAAPAHELILLAHHAIIDGAATCTLFDQLLSEAAAASAVNGNGHDYRPLAPCAEDLCSHGLSWEEFEARQAAMARGSDRVELVRYARRAPFDARVTRVLPFSLSLQTSEQLLERSRNARVSLNSYVSAIFLSAVKLASPDRSRFVLATALSLRPLCGAGLPVDALGCYLSVVSTTHDIPDARASVVPLAKEHQSAILSAAVAYARNPERVDLDQLSASMASLADADRFVNDMGLTFLEASLQPRYGSIELQAFYGSANRTAGNVAAVLQVVRMNGRLHCTLNYTSPLQSDAWARHVADEVVRLLEENA